MRVGVAALALFVALGCAPPSGVRTAVEPEGPPAPARPAGCAVTVLESGVPVSPRRDLGRIRVTCGPDVPPESCTRALKDAACALGADLVWGVADISKVVGLSRLRATAARADRPADPPPPEPHEAR